MDLFSILTHGLVLLVGGFIGIGLGRRSKKANTYYDEFRARAERAEARLREMGE
jgi:hypothetical protein